MHSSLRLALPLALGLLVACSTGADGSEQTSSAGSSGSGGNSSGAGGKSSGGSGGAGGSAGASGGVTASGGASAGGAGGSSGNTNAGSAGTQSSGGSAGSTYVPPTGKKCIVHLHGKSGSGGPSSDEGDVRHVAPTGNADGWGGKQWLYFPEDGYVAVRTIIADAITAEACGQVIMHGFSNGASAAAKLYCRGETFGGTMLGYVVDDPVTDHAVETCAPVQGIELQLYETGGLSYAVDGWDCVGADWTCEGNTTIGMTKYEAELGTVAVQSIHTDHQPYNNPPEYGSWW